MIGTASSHCSSLVSRSTVGSNMVGVDWLTGQRGTLPWERAPDHHKTHLGFVGVWDMDQRDVVGEGYDEIAEAYDEYRSDEAPAQFEDGIGEAFFEELPAGSRVLDAGCGGGRPVLERLDRDHDAVGLDISTSQPNWPASAFPLPGSPAVTLRRCRSPTTRSTPSSRTTQ